MGATTIEWTNAVWNPLKGCSLKSPGCRFCYAMRQAPRTDALSAGAEFVGPPGALTKPSKNGPVFTGQVRFIENKLLDPLGWKKPKSIFVNSMSDLFHEDVPDEWIDRIFAVMALAPQHRFQVLTKRADRMRRYFSGIDNGDGEWIEGAYMRDALIEGMAQKIYAERTGEDPSLWLAVHMPLPNVWLGVSVEDQQRADERIPDLLATPAAVRWISAEPLLGPIDLKGWAHPAWDGAIRRARPAARLNWVVAGGESGHRARPMHPDWPRALRDQCAATGTPFFFKQWGHWAAERKDGAVMSASGTGQPDIAWPDGTIAFGDAADHGGPGVSLYPKGKSKAGRLLDGIEHSAMPEIRA